jgi:hypothetical protein
MRLAAAILVTLVLTWIAGLMGQHFGKYAMWMTIAVYALWAAIDSHRIGLIRYRTIITHSPPVIFFGCFAFWIIVFPVYLIVRAQIVCGQARLKRPLP